MNTATLERKVNASRALADLPIDATQARVLARDEQPMMCAAVAIATYVIFTIAEGLLLAWAQGGSSQQPM